MKIKEKFVIKGKVIETQDDLDGIFIDPKMYQKLSAAGKVTLDKEDNDMIVKRQKQEDLAIKRRAERAKKGKNS